MFICLKIMVMYYNNLYHAYVTIMVMQYYVWLCAMVMYYGYVLWLCMYNIYIYNTVYIMILTTVMGQSWDYYLGWYMQCMHDAWW